ncbi:MAG: DUF3604 domain-containing protein [Halieaceae bacterium]
MAILLLACEPLEDPTLQPAFDQNTRIELPEKPAVEKNPLRNLLWGDLHIHTSYSTDAYTMGVRATPDDAYLFTRGGTIQHGAGYPITIDRPLDFAAVTDHAEYMGAARLDPTKTVLEERSLRDRLLNDGALGVTVAFIRSTMHIAGADMSPQGDALQGAGLDAWRHMIETADAHYDPGVFTALVAYEWTAMIGGQNLHRNVIYRDNRVPPLPFSSLQSNNPEDLWDALDAQREQGMRVLAIPHNGNLSNGLMYDRVQFDGSPLTTDYSARRRRNEPVSEILQIKGTSETHPLLSPEDEFADFELVTEQLDTAGDFSEPAGSYVRDAMRFGLELSHSEGFNPYKFGVIGSSDSHNASSSVQESEHHGKLPIMDGTAGLRLGKALVLPDRYLRQRRWGSAGLAAVWAQENTRAAIFDALQRRETYATSGPRIGLRFFGGFAYPQDMLSHPDWLEAAYRLGVPMGGELTAASLEDGAPRFAVSAGMDPEGAHLDRVQVIKGWVDAAGVSHERIYDVGASTGRGRDAEGRLLPVGSTVDVPTASYSNTIGAPQLSALWRDPDFDPAIEAFYYARAIEIPTPRWSTYDAMKLGIPAPEPATLQERAISSAIWYRPAR